MTVAQLNDSLDVDELIHWQAFFKLEDEDMKPRRPKDAGSPNAED